jgi:uncharacterized protein
MNAVAVRRDRARAARRDVDVLSWAALATGFVLLLGRLWLIREGALSGPMVAAVFLALAAVSVAAPEIRAGTRPAVSPGAALMVGAGAAVAATFAGALSGPAPSLAASPGVLAAVVGAAIAEEAFFRRLLYGRLLRWGAPVAVVGSALSFAAVHVPLHGTASFAVDLGAGLVLSWQRWAGGRWEVPAATHALANVLAVAR